MIHSEENTTRLFLPEAMSSCTEQILTVSTFKNVFIHYITQVQKDLLCVIFFKKNRESVYTFSCKILQGQ